jgi:hypothetical protein
LIDVLASVREPGPSPATGASCRTPFTTVAWLMPTPLGVPVEPEVYMT